MLLQLLFIGLSGPISFPVSAGILEYTSCILASKQPVFLQPVPSYILPNQCIRTRLGFEPLEMQGEGSNGPMGSCLSKLKKKKKKEEKDQCNTQLVKTILKADHNKFKFVWQGGLRIIKANKIQEDKNSKS